MPTEAVSRPLANAVTITQQAAGPIMAMMAVAVQPAASNSRRGIQRRGEARSRDRAAASTNGIAISNGAKPLPAAPGR